MKKGMRIVAIAAVVCLLCLSLGGCKALDSARAAQGFWTEFGLSFTIGGEEYIRLPQSDVLNLLYVDHGSEVQTIYVTEEDVPVLLSPFYGHPLDATADGMLYVDSLSAFSSQTVYCKADQYAEMVAQLEKGFQPVGFCCVYTLIDPETYEYSSRLYRLTMEETAMIGALLEAERTYLDKMMQIAYDYSITINRCNDNMLLQEAVVDLCCSGDDYFLYGEDDNGEWAVPVPAEYRETAKALLAPMEQVMSGWEQEYSEDYEDFLAL